MKTLAVLCPLAILLLVGCTPAASTPAPSAPAAAVNANVKVTHMIALKVPTMHCPHGCWPTVEETLAAEPGVGTLQLAEQKEEGAIDNPVVYVGVDDKFGAEHAIAALADKGFKESSVEAKGYEEVKN